MRTITSAHSTTSNTFLHLVLNIDLIEEITNKLQQQFIESFKDHPNMLIKRIIH